MLCVTTIYILRVSNCLRLWKDYQDGYFTIEIDDVFMKQCNDHGQFILFCFVSENAIVDLCKAKKKKLLSKRAATLTPVP